MARQRLDERLECVTAYPLTVVIAPAGSGKTQLMSSWVGRATVPTAWLSLEELDDDPVELWSGIVAALEQLAPGCGRVATERCADGATADEVVGAVLDGLDRDSDTASVVVFDDVHHLQSAATVRSFATFVQHVPSWLHVVLVGRADPPLPLDRLRVRGQLGEVRFADLRFTDAEARQMLASLAPDLSESEIDESARSADGWAAGVQLTGLVARSARDEATAVALRRDVQLRTEDYVWHEVLATADPDIVDALMQVAVVDRVNPALAAAITGDADVRELLLRRSRKACSCPGSDSRTGSASIPSSGRCCATSSSARCGTTSATSAPPGGWNSPARSSARSTSGSSPSDPVKPSDCSRRPRPNCTTRAATP